MSIKERLVEIGSLALLIATLTSCGGGEAPAAPTAIPTVAPVEAPALDEASAPVEDVAQILNFNDLTIMALSCDTVGECTGGNIVTRCVVNPTSQDETRQNTLATHSSWGSLADCEAATIVYDDGGEEEAVVIEEAVEVAAGEVVAVEEEPGFSGRYGEGVLTLDQCLSLPEDHCMHQICLTDEFQRYVVGNETWVPPTEGHWRVFGDEWNKMTEVFVFWPEDPYLPIQAGQPYIWPNFHDERILSVDYLPIAHICTADGALNDFSGMNIFEALSRQMGQEMVTVPYLNALKDRAHEQYILDHPSSACESDYSPCWEGEDIERYTAVRPKVPMPLDYPLITFGDEDALRQLMKQVKEDHEQFRIEREDWTTGLLTHYLGPEGDDWRYLTLAEANEYADLSPHQRLPSYYGGDDVWFAGYGGCPGCGEYQPYIFVLIDALPVEIQTGFYCVMDELPFDKSWVATTGGAYRDRILRLNP